MRLKIHRVIVVGKVIKLAAEAVEQVKGIESLSILPFGAVSCLLLPSLANDFYGDWAPRGNFCVTNCH
jgi:hypothetical protein